MSEINNCFLCKLTFCNIQFQIGISKFEENVLERLEMIAEGSAGNDDAQSNMLMSLNRDCKSFKSHRCIADSKGEDVELIDGVSNLKGSKTSNFPLSSPDRIRFSDQKWRKICTH